MLPLPRRPVIAIVALFIIVAVVLLNLRRVPIVQLRNPVSGLPTFPKPAQSIDAGADLPKWFDGNWDWKRDGRNRLLNDAQCGKAFPNLYAEIDRAVATRRDANITRKDVDAVDRKMKGYVRGLISDGQIFITETAEIIHTRPYSVIQSLYRAIVTSPEPIPNIEFTFNTWDSAPSASTWAFDRNADDASTWLIPDFGFWSWPQPHVHSYEEVQRKALEMEEGLGVHVKLLGVSAAEAWTWNRKKPQLAWRGALIGSARRQLLDRTRDAPWADVRALKWGGGSSALKADLLSMDEHCQYKFVAHTESDGAYSGRLKYLLNCRSVVFMPRLKWVEHFHPLLVADGPHQNYVQVAADYSDLQQKVEELLADDAKARRIADNSVRVFRERYLTPAAESCYWRRLLRAWRSVSYEPEVYEIKGGKRVQRGVSAEDWLLERRLHWDPY
ncbi:MAG: hypothetical protein M1825_004252 [Sarcosagium campestre]|nr:MAG: hypothetical protein M1825_004252 [Sarcosagium campestre]